MFTFARSFRPLAAAALAVVALPAAATHVELQAGRSYMSTYPTNTVFVESVFAEHPLGNSSLHWAPDVSLGWIDGRDPSCCNNTRYSNRYSVRKAIWLAAGGVRLSVGHPGDWYRHFFFSFQVAMHSGRTQALSTPYEFASTLGWQWHHLSLQIRHISNGWTHEPNRGETMALVGVGFDLK